MIYIRNKISNETILKERCSIKKITSIYSNTKQPIFKLIIDSTPISRNNTYTVKYKCQTCLIEQEITLNLYMRKVNKEITGCDACKNRDVDKCNNHREFMKQNGTTVLSGCYIKNETIKVKTFTVDKHLEKSLSDWKEEEPEFKDKYFLYHLSHDDFERVRDKIISINNDKFINISDWNYFPSYRVYNQSRYTPMLVHKTDGIVEKPLYLKFKCDNCDDVFIHRDIEVIKNQYKILCKTCSFTNKIFCLRKYTCKNGLSVMWQSIPERRFIEWCEEHDITIKNGPNIEYTFNNYTHTYRVDFELPQYNILIEMKDNHCWHKQQVESGKFGAKENSANEWCKIKNYKYYVVFPKTLQKMKDFILEKTL
jgi:predicted RNA-binding Zn-ribbon protein involved in translation (DUF1610 family)